MSETKDYMLPCLNKKIFGVDCPGCGMQRSLKMVSEGAFTDAFYMFPPVYTTLAFVFAVIIHFILKKKITSKIIIILAIINVVVILIAFIIKINKMFK